MNVCKFVCLFVCLYLMQIHISEQISIELCTRLPLRLEEVVGYVWTHNIWPFSTFSTSSVRSQCRILGTTWLPAQESLRQCYIRDLADDTCAKSHPRQPYVHDVADDTRVEVFWAVGKWEKWTECKCVNIVTWWDRKEVNNELQLQLHLILAGDTLASWKCRSRRRSHPPRRRIPYSGGCSCHVTDITFNRATGPFATALYPSF